MSEELAQNEKALVVQPQVALRTFDEVKEQVQSLDKFYRQLMQKGTDYDTIPGTPKPTLLKSGAELLRLRFGYTPRFTVDSTGTDLDKGIFNYEVKCSLYGTEGLIGEGVGSCNSLEAKYRYRWVGDRDIPQGLSKDVLPKKWQKTKGGGSFPLYRVENENPQDLANTILKMAKKRAFIDATLTVTGASRIFTQDMEDVNIGAKDNGDFEEVSPTVETAQASETPPGSYAVLANRFGDMIGHCWEHGDEWKVGQYGRYHYVPKTEENPKGFCNFKDRLKPITKEIVEARGMDASAFNEFLKEHYGGKTWSKIDEVEQLAILSLLSSKKEEEPTD